MMAFSENGVCPSCETANSTEPVFDEESANEFDDFQTVPVSGFSQELNTEIEPDEDFSPPSYSQNFDDFQSLQSDRPSYQSAPRVSCMLCNKLIPAVQKVCSECANKKSPMKKLFTAFAVLAILAILGGGVYAYKFYLENAPMRVLDDYAKATGSDKMANIQNLSLKGKVKIKVSTSPINQGLQTRSMEEFLLFDLILENPNKSYMEFFKNNSENNPSQKEVFYKQAFDGFNSWKFVRLFDQPAQLEDTPGGVEGSKPEFFLQKYDSVEYLNDEIKKEYGEEALEQLTSITSFAVDGNLKMSNSKEIVQVKKNNDKTLMVFDKKSHLLLGILKIDNSKGSPLTATIYADNYRTLKVKEKNAGEVSVLLANQWKFEMYGKNVESSKVDVSVSMTLNIESVETDITVDPKIFYKPISIYTAENKNY